MRDETVYFVLMTIAVLLSAIPTASSSNESELPPLAEDILSGDHMSSMFRSLQGVTTLILSYLNGIWNWPTIVLCFVVGSVLLAVWHSRNRAINSRKESPSGSGRLPFDNNGFEILRPSRDRTTTFDFFGTHTPLIHRKQSDIVDDWGDTSRRIMTDLRKERKGSMDLYYAQEGNPLDVSERTKSNKSSSEGKPASILNRARSDSLASVTGRSEVPSNIFFPPHNSAPATMNEQPGSLYDEFGLITLSFDIKYYGPLCETLVFDSWTPPVSWSAASRQILPPDAMLKLHRKISFNVIQGTVLIQEPSFNKHFDIVIPQSELSVHVNPPVEGGVLSLYKKGTTKEKWMEHTFESAQCAAQFQQDLLAFQLLGKTLNNMYKTLSLVHLGSIAFDGEEYVLHNDEAYSQQKPEESDAEFRNFASTGVAWDDAMRALSSIPAIRIALERLWLSKRKNERDNPIPDSINALLTPEYRGRRLLIGPVDFFRLFVPALPDSALPHAESSRARMQQLLSWRKRAARSAVLIKTYVASHRVVNIGWSLDDGQPETLLRRLAFDDNDANMLRDATVRNECYEASVSRDVLCHVRSDDYFENADFNSPEVPKIVLSPYQAYSLVGIHSFKKESKETPYSLLPSRDPVDAIPSLQALIRKNPDLHFIVTSYHRNDHISLMCFVRSLPENVDPPFDAVMSRFTHGGKKERDRKMHMMIQVGQTHTFSLLGMIILRFLLFLFGLTTKGRESALSLQSRRDRTTFPALRMSSFGQTSHFGGMLQRDVLLPRNYVSMNVVLGSKEMPSLVSRLLFDKLDNLMPTLVVDFTLALEGETDDELPERALCTARLVRVDADAVAKTPNDTNTAVAERTETVFPDDPGSVQAVENMTRYASFLQLLLPIRRLRRQDEGPPENDEQDGSKSHDSQIATCLETNDSTEKAINEVICLLEGVTVPILSVHSPVLQNELVLRTVRRSDICRFLLVCDLDIKQAAVRVVETAAWRGRVFPIDSGSCRVELHSKQVVPFGVDSEGNFVFYFNSVRRGPWRRNVDATIVAALYTLDNFLAGSKSWDPFCLVILMGTFEPEKKRASTDNEDPNNETPESGSKDPENALFFNSRVSAEEVWQLHANVDLLEELIRVLLTHYPKMLSKVLFVSGDGPHKLFRSSAALHHAMKPIFHSARSPDISKILPTSRALRQFIDVGQLPPFLRHHSS